MRYLTLFSVFLRIGIMGELAYRANLLVQLFVSILDLGTALGGLAIVFAHTATLGGWRPDEVLALVGVYFLVGGLIRLLIQPSMERLIESVREGTLDFILTKPEDAQILVSIQRVEIWKLTDVAFGIGVLTTALVRLGSHINVRQVVAFGAVLVAGVVIVYSFWLILATLSFWFVKIENILVIFQSMYEAGRWPVSLYPSWLRFALTFLVPIAFATTVPAQALSGRLTWQVLLGTVGLAMGLFGCSRLFWKTAVRRYSGASA